MRAVRSAGRGAGRSAGRSAERSAERSGTTNSASMTSVNTVKSQEEKNEFLNKFFSFVSIFPYLIPTQIREWLSKKTTSVDENFEKLERLFDEYIETSKQDNQYNLAIIAGIKEDQQTNEIKEMYRVLEENTSLNDASDKLEYIISISSLKKALKEFMETSHSPDHYLETTRVFITVNKDNLSLAEKNIPDIKKQLDLYLTNIGIMDNKGKIQNSIIGYYYHNVSPIKWAELPELKQLQDEYRKILEQIKEPHQDRIELDIKSKQKLKEIQHRKTVDKMKIDGTIDTEINVYFELQALEDLTLLAERIASNNIDKEKLNDKIINEISIHMDGVTINRSVGSKIQVPPSLHPSFNKWHQSDIQLSMGYFSEKLESSMNLSEYNIHLQKHTKRFKEEGEKTLLGLTKANIVKILDDLEKENYDPVYIKTGRDNYEKVKDTLSYDLAKEIHQEHAKEYIPFFKKKISDLLIVFKGNNIDENSTNDIKKFLDNPLLVKDCKTFEVLQSLYHEFLKALKQKQKELGTKFVTLEQIQQQHQEIDEIIDAEVQNLKDQKNIDRILDDILGEIEQEQAKEKAEMDRERQKQKKLNDLKNEEHNYRNSLSNARNEFQNSIQATQLVYDDYINALGDSSVVGDDLRRKQSVYQSSQVELNNKREKWVSSNKKWKIPRDKVKKLIRSHQDLQEQEKDVLLADIRTQIEHNKKIETEYNTIISVMNTAIETAKQARDIAKNMTDDIFQSVIKKAKAEEAKAEAEVQSEVVKNPLWAILGNTFKLNVFVEEIQKAVEDERKQEEIAEADQVKAAAAAKVEAQEEFQKLLKSMTEKAKADQVKAEAKAQAEAQAKQSYHQVTQNFFVPSPPLTEMPNLLTLEGVSERRPPVDLAEKVLFPKLGTPEGDTISLPERHKTPIQQQETPPSAFMALDTAALFITQPISVKYVNPNDDLIYRTFTHTRFSEEYLAQRQEHVNHVINASKLLVQDFTDKNYFSFIEKQPAWVGAVDSLIKLYPVTSDFIKKYDNLKILFDSNKGLYKDLLIENKKIIEAQRKIQISKAVLAAIAAINVFSAGESIRTQNELSEINTQLSRLNGQNIPIAYNSGNILENHRMLEENHRQAVDEYQALLKPTDTGYTPIGNARRLFHEHIKKVFFNFIEINTLLNPTVVVR